MATRTNSKGEEITEAVLSNGQTVRVNDHVYVDPTHLGEAFHIGRVMEFANLPGKKGLHARIAWFGRTKEFVARRTNDPRLLIATFNSDFNPVGVIRGLCTVTHKYYVPEDLDVYKSREDHFYYHRFYDRYIARFYEVVPCELVRNVPNQAKASLQALYQYIITEPTKAVELTGTHRVCHICNDWCSSADSVKCSTCQNHYHMECLNPPMIKKPSKGFAWECAWCSRKDADMSSEDELEDSSETQTADSTPSRSTNNASTPSTARGTKRLRSPVQPAHPATKHKTTHHRANGNADAKRRSSHADQGPRSPKGVDIMTHMWPFRYFGIHSNVHDVIDPDDPIYPRVKSRIGAKYQAVVLDWDDQVKAEEERATKAGSRETKGPGRGRGRKPNRGGRPSTRSKILSEGDAREPADVGIPVRGTDETITKLFVRPETVSDEQVDAYITAARKAIEELPKLADVKQNMDVFDRMILEYQRSGFDKAAAIAAITMLTKEDLDIKTWNKEEEEAFETAIAKYGKDWEMVHEALPHVTFGQIIRHFYQWKKTDRYQPVYSEWTTENRPGKVFKTLPSNGDSQMDEDEEEDSDSEESSDEDTTIIAPPRRGSMQYVNACMNCGEEHSAIWRRAPGDTDKRRKHHTKVLCDKCGIYWLKYSIMREVPDALSKRGGKFGKLEAAKLFKRKMDMRRRAGGETNGRRGRSPTPFPPSPCAVCQSLEPSKILFTCRECGLSAHQDCYGIQAAAGSHHWYCDTCQNNKNPLVSTTYKCVLCSNVGKAAHHALKKTSGNNWAHVLCATFLPEIKFADTDKLQPVEGVGMVALHRWKDVCKICNTTGGAVAACGDCKKPIHVSCAQENKYVVVFELNPVKASRHVTTIPSSSFPSGGGLMVPMIWCPDHDLKGKRLLNIRDMDLDTKKCALSTYVKNYKQSDTSSTGAMRKSRIVVSASNNLSYNHHLTNVISHQTAPTSVPGQKSQSLTIPPAHLGSRKALSEWAMSQPPPKYSCLECHTTVSPMWWDPPEMPNGRASEGPDTIQISLESAREYADHMEHPSPKLCQKCYWKRKPATPSASLVTAN